MTSEPPARHGPRFGVLAVVRRRWKLAASSWLVHLAIRLATHLTTSCHSSRGLAQRKRLRRDDYDVRSSAGLPQETWSRTHGPEIGVASPGHEATRGCGRSRTVHSAYTQLAALSSPRRPWWRTKRYDAERCDARRSAHLDAVERRSAHLNAVERRSAHLDAVEPLSSPRCGGATLSSPRRPPRWSGA